MSGGIAQGTMLGKYVRFMKLAPFVGFPVLMFFPAGMSLYWVIVAGMHLLMTLFSNSRAFRTLAGTQDYLPNTILYREFIRNQELLRQGTLYVNKPNYETAETAPIAVNQTSLNVVAPELEKVFNKPKLEEPPVEKPAKPQEKPSAPKIEKQLDDNHLVQGKNKDGRNVKLFTSKPKKQ